MVLILTRLRWHLGAAFTRLAFLVIPGRGLLPASPESITPALGLWIPDSTLRVDPE
jgi:hypothetical protein